jgi:hypothetical protein
MEPHWHGSTLRIQYDNFRCGFGEHFPGLDGGLHSAGEFGLFAWLIKSEAVPNCGTALFVTAIGMGGGWNLPPGSSYRETRVGKAIAVLSTCQSSPPLSRMKAIALNVTFPIRASSAVKVYVKEKAVVRFADRGGTS